MTRFYQPGYGRSPIAAARGAAGLRRAMGSFRPDVIHSHNVKSTALVAAARASRGVRPPWWQPSTGSGGGGPEHLG